jgi:hypothetical protein
MEQPVLHLAEPAVDNDFVPSGNGINQDDYFTSQVDPLRRSSSTLLIFEAAWTLSCCSIMAAS